MPSSDLPKRYFMRLQIYNQEPHFGKGVISLLVLIKKKYSMRAACRMTGIAYSKAWKLIKAAEFDLGFALIDGTAGGSGGGGSRLTLQGEELLDKYLGFEKAAAAALDALFAEYFGENPPEQGAKTSD